MTKAFPSVLSVAVPGLPLAACGPANPSINFLFSRRSALEKETWRQSIALAEGHARHSEPVKVDTDLVDGVQGLLGPTMILAGAPGRLQVPADDPRSLAGWSSRAAEYLRSRARTPSPSDGVVPCLQSADFDLQASACADWCRTMEARVREVDARLQGASSARSPAGSRQEEAKQ